MGFVPEDAKWYVADIVQEITVEGDPRNVVHTNIILVRADSPEEAYAKAQELGAAGEISYENPEGRPVAIRFRGLRNLTVIHDELQHGAELWYGGDIGMDEAAIQRWLRPKEALGVFAPRRPLAGPNYVSGEIVKELHRQFPDLAPDDDLVH